MSRIDDMPVYESREDKVEASLYNLWRRARAHKLLPARFNLFHSPQMVVLIESNSWVVVDQNQFDLPMLAWVDFQDKGRSSIHTPVACTLNFYHFMATSLRAKALKKIADGLEQMLAKKSNYF